MERNAGGRRPVVATPAASASGKVVGSRRSQSAGSLAGRGNVGRGSTAATAAGPARGSSALRGAKGRGDAQPARDDSRSKGGDSSGTQALALASALLEEPLRQLVAALAQDGMGQPSEGSSETLSPLVAFLQKLLSSLLQLRRMLSLQPAPGEDERSGKASALDLREQLLLGFVAEAREELTRWGRHAASALCSLVATADVHGFGAKLQSVQERLAATLDNMEWQQAAVVAAGYRERRAAEEAKAAAEEASEMSAQHQVEKMEWVSGMHRVREELQAAATHSVAQLVALQEQEASQLAVVHAQFSRQVAAADALSSELAEARADRDAERFALEGRREMATGERRSAQRSLEEEKQKAAASCMMLEESRGQLLGELREARRIYKEELASQSQELQTAQCALRDSRLEEEGRRSMRESLLTSTQAEAQREMAEERRQRASLAQQLTEALDTMSHRDVVIDELRRSLQLQQEQMLPPARNETLNAPSEPLAPFLPSPIRPQRQGATGVQQSAGGFDRSDNLTPLSAYIPELSNVNFGELRQGTEGHSRTAEAQPRMVTGSKIPTPGKPGQADGADSLCRMSTESMPYYVAGRPPRPASRTGSGYATPVQPQQVPVQHQQAPQKPQQPHAQQFQERQQQQLQQLQELQGALRATALAAAQAQAANFGPTGHGHYVGHQRQAVASEQLNSSLAPASPFQPPPPMEPVTMAHRDMGVRFS
eukprot:TRINITY_DN9481_c1_g4_i1.p1 TRINITY_DN9481_c1_g4~~TRINITY_DN9481_c1_g4_i1.p1  ORF type:complete len:714 (-),score=216.92 TRINITY_DN9481_c1_g4_i1:58-2199(-)